MIGKTWNFCCIHAGWVTGFWILLFSLTGLGESPGILVSSPEENGSHVAQHGSEEEEETKRDRADKKPPPPSSVQKSQVPVQLRGHDRYYRVEVVFDGDSLKLKNGNELRLIGVDAPEESHEYATEARNFVRRCLPENSIIGVDFDDQHRDRYDRLLGYVHTIFSVEQNKHKPIMVNLALLKRGLAHTYLNNENTQYVNRLIAAQKQSIQLERNLFRHLSTEESTLYRVHGRFRYHHRECEIIQNIPEEVLDRFRSRKEALLQGCNGASCCVSNEN